MENTIKDLARELIANALSDARFAGSEELDKGIIVLAAEIEKAESEDDLKTAFAKIEEVNSDFYEKLESEWMANHASTGDLASILS